jgi:hypothetical protein
MVESLIIELKLHILLSGEFRLATSSVVAELLFRGPPFQSTLLKIKTKKQKPKKKRKRSLFQLARISDCYPILALQVVLNSLLYKSHRYLYPSRGYLLSAI